MKDKPSLELVTQAQFQFKLPAPGRISVVNSSYALIQARDDLVHFQVGAS
jgi:hypothetical protein